LSVTPLHRTAVLWRLAVLALLLAASRAPAHADPLADPTRPAGAAERPSASTSRSSGTTAAPPLWPQLQSIQVGAPGGASALLDGRVVRIGERIGEVTVVAIDAQGVLLRAARYEQRIALVPGIVKTASAATPPTAHTAMSLATKETK
jgi:MSHA biogenesis protein MshK